MLDFSHLPPSSASKTDVFYCVAQSATTTNSWQTWPKPRGCSWVYMLVLGGGGGGGSPATGSVQGGGGGSSAGLGRALIPAALLPDTLYIRVGNGGIGATTANSSGGTATTTYIGTYPITSSGCNIFSGNGGNGGLATTGGTAAGVVLYNYAYFGAQATTNGIAGGNGGASGAAGTSITYAVSATVVPFTGGAGGAGYAVGTTSNGGSIAFANSYPALTLAGVPGNGPDGYGRNQRLDFNGPRGANVLFFTGGCGGGATLGVGTNGGNGGHGGYGCGGGGGGGSSGTGDVPGNGGNGGDGLVIISSW